MVDTTQKQEALQAVRLLFVAACGGGSSDHKNPETLYRVRQMLEGFIESARILENTDTPSIDEAGGVNELVYRGAKFRVGEQALVKTPAMGVQWMNIVKFFPVNFGVSLEGHGYKGSASYDELADLNPNGSKGPQ